MEPNYRKDIYKNYATDFNGHSEDLTLEQYQNSWPIYDYYFRAWIRKKGPNVSALDLGCGNGGLLLYLRDRLGFKDVKGVDISESQIAIAKSVVSEVEEADAINFLRDSNETFDYIFALDLIEHLNKSDALEFIDLCKNSLKPGGHLILQTPNAASIFFGSVRYGDFTHEQAFTPQLLEKLLARAGYQIVGLRESHPVPLGYSVSSTMRYLLWKILSGLLRLCQLVETGSINYGVNSKVFLIAAKRPLDS